MGFVVIEEREWGLWVGMLSDVIRRVGKVGEGRGGSMCFGSLGPVVYEVFCTVCYINFVLLAMQMCRFADLQIGGWAG